MHLRKELIRQIQSDPLSLRHWTLLQQSYIESGDTMSAKSVAIIVQGLAELREQAENSGTLQEPRLSNMQRHALTRLAVSHNSPRLLKEVGIFYLHDFRLPAVAIHHFELAKRFDTADPDLSVLIESAKRVLDRQTLGSTPGSTGVTAAKHTRPPAKEMVVKTGKLAFRNKAEGLPAIPGSEEDEQERQKRRKDALPPVPDVDLPAAPESQVPAEKPPTGTFSDTRDLHHFAEQQAVLYRDETYSLQQASDEIGKLAADGEYPKALTLLDAFIEQVPSSDLRWSAATMLGQACFGTGNFQFAQEAFERAASIVPDEMVSWFNLGLALQNQGFVHEAMEVYQRADRLEPDHPKVWCNLSALYFQCDQLEQAEQAARRSIERSPTYARSWDNLATALGAMDRLEEAEQACLRAVAFKPDFLDPWLKLGMIFFQQERLEESEAAFMRAQGLSETSAYALSYLSIIRTRMGRIKDAVSAVREAIEVDPSCELIWMCWNDIGMAHLRSEEFSAAEKAFAHALEAHPDSFQAWYNLSLAQQRAGEFEKARKSLQEALQRDPKSKTAWRNLGLVARDMDDASGAIEAFQRLTQLEPENATAWADYAGALEKSGRKEAAQEARRKAREITTRQNAEASKLGKAFSFLRSNS